jgi:hypothetical protein
MKSIPSAAFLLASSILVAASSGALADRLDVVVPLNVAGNSSVDAPGGLATVGFLVTRGDGRKLALTVTPTKTKGAPLLVPDVKLVAPDGTEYAFDGAGDAASAAGASTWKARIVDVPQTGLWRLEVRGANGTSGAFSATVKGKDALSLKTAPSVPATGTTDVEIVVGENTTLTLSTKRSALSPTLVPRLQILDAGGHPLESGRTFVANAKGVLKLTAYRLPVFGRYVLRFSGSDGVGGEFALTAKTAPARLPKGLPIADARAVVTLAPGVEDLASAGDVEPGWVGTLDATRSSAASGDALSYRWTQVSGPRVVLSGADTARPTFVATPTPESLAFQLSVSTSGVPSKAATVAVEVAKRPVADSGRAQHAALGAAVTLDGGASTDRRGAGLRYVWTQWPTDATPVTLRDAATARPSFDAPAVAGALHFSLVVDDGTARSYRDVVLVDVGAPERRVAEAGRDQWVAPMSTVYLSGLASAATSTTVLDGNVAWTQTAGPSVALVGADTPWPSFQAPKAPADLAFKLTLDGIDALSDTVSVHVRGDESDVAPTTHGNGTFAAPPGVVALSATSSVDPTNDPLLARWAQTTGAPLTLSDADAPTAHATLPAGNAQFTFAVQVNDGLQYGAPDLVHVRNTGYAGLPLALAGPDVAVTVPGAAVALDGRNSSRTSGTGPLTYEWTQINCTEWFDVAARVPTFDRTAARPVFALPATLSSLSPTRTMLFELVVDDGTSKSLPDYVTVTFANLVGDSPPTVTASASTTSAIVGQTVTLTGTKDDLDTDPANVTVQWIQTQNGAPAATLSPSATVLNPSFVMPDTTTALSFKLVAYDGTSQSAPALVTVAVDRKPTAAIAVTPPNGAPGTVITFDGAGSTDPENHALTYRWTQLLPATTQLVADLTTRSISFVATGGAAKFQLVVNDGRQDSAPAVATFLGVTASPSAAPLDVTVNGAAPFPGDVQGFAAYGATVTLSANPVGAGGSPTFTWRVISQTPSAMPTISLSSTTDANPTFVVPVPGATAFGFSPKPQATFGVVVHSGGQDSAEATLTVYFFASLNNGTASQAATPSNNTVYGIVTPNCIGCHSGTSNYCPVGSGSSAPGFGMGTKTAFLANTRNITACASSKTRVPAVGVTGQSATNSYLLDRLTGIATPQMPQGFSSFLPAAKINIFRDWIDQGSLDN